MKCRCAWKNYILKEKYIGVNFQGQTIDGCNPILELTVCFLKYFKLKSIILLLLFFNHMQ